MITMNTMIGGEQKKSINICVVGFLYVKHKAIARGTVIEFTE